MAGGAGASGSDAPAPSDGDLIAAPDGRDDAAGTLAAPTTLTAAITRIAAGKTIFLRGGTYAHDTQITIAADNSGAMGPGAIRVSNTLSFDNARAKYRFGDNGTPTQAFLTNNVSFRTAAGGEGDKRADLINAGAVPDGDLPFDPTYYRGMPDLGAIETP